MILSSTVASVGIGSAVIVNVLDPAPTQGHQQGVASSGPPEPVSQQGTVVAVSPDSVTARSDDGFARTYVLNQNTAVITDKGAEVGTAATTFAVNDEVAIVGTVRGGTAVATAVADQDVANLQGPPMDDVSTAPIG